MRKQLFLCAVLSMMFVANRSHAQEGNRFLQSRAWSYSNAIVGSHNNADWQNHSTVGMPRHYVTSYQFIITELFGYQFQCATSRGWVSDLDEHGNPDECQAYLESTAMRLSDEYDDFNPYANACWEGTLLVKSPSYYQLLYTKNYYQSLTYGTEVMHRMRFKATNIVTGYTVDIIRDFDDMGNHSDYPDSYFPPGVYTLLVCSEAGFPNDPVYYGFECIQGGVFFRLARVE